MSNDTSSSGSYDPAQLGNTLGNQLTAAATDTSSLYQGMGETTKTSLEQLLAGADPAGYSGYINDAITSMGETAAGNRYGMDDPGYATLRNKVQDDAMTSSLSAFNNSGLFGSDSNQKATGEGVGNALASLDYSNYQNDQTQQANAIAALPGLYDASQSAARTGLEVGAIQDADASAVQSASYDRLMEVLSAFNGSQGSAGMTEETPWWQQVLGYVAGNAGNAVKALS